MIKKIDVEKEQQGCKPFKQNFKERQSESVFIIECEFRASGHSAT